jgi:hypothetical protein
MMPGCIRTPLNQSSVNPQENIPMNSLTQMHSLSAEEISLRMLKLIDRIKTHQDINAEHINSVIGVRLVPNADQAKYLSFAQILNAQWWYGFTLNSDPKDTKLVFNFNTTAGVAEDVAATAICVIDFDHYVSALKTMGFEGNITYGEHGRILNWSFYRDGINVQMSYRGESNENVDHKCVSSIVIN